MMSNAFSASANPAPRPRHLPFMLAGSEENIRLIEPILRRWDFRLWDHSITQIGRNLDFHGASYMACVPHGWRIDIDPSRDFSLAVDENGRERVCFVHTQDNPEKNERAHFEVIILHRLTVYTPTAERQKMVLFDRKRGSPYHLSGNLPPGSYATGTFMNTLIKASCVPPLLAAQWKKDPSLLWDDNDYMTPASIARAIANFERTAGIIGSMIDLPPYGTLQL